MSSAKKQMSSLEEDARCANQEAELKVGKQTSIPDSSLEYSAKTMAGTVKDCRQTPLSIFVRERLSALGMRQSEFCRLTGFDQGLLSKIQSSLITNLSLESVLRLAIGLSVSPQQILALISRGDLHTLMKKAYPLMLLGPIEISDRDIPAPVLKINQLAMQAYELGSSLAPAIAVLSNLATCHAERLKGNLAGYPSLKSD